MLRWYLALVACLFAIETKWNTLHRRSRSLFANGFGIDPRNASCKHVCPRQIISSWGSHGGGKRRQTLAVSATNQHDRQENIIVAKKSHGLRDFEKKVIPTAVLVVASLLSLNVATAHAESIKTFDMSLPSYDKISDAKSSIAGVEQKESELMELKRAKEAKAKSANSGFSMPSFGSGGGGSPSSSSSGGGAFAVGSPSSADKEKAKLEKLAARQAKIAAQKAADEERERKMKEKIEVVDFDMPTYDNSGAGFGKKSVFSL